MCLHGFLDTWRTWELVLPALERQHEVLARIVWGTSDRVLPWPRAAARFRDHWPPYTDWVELDGIGHCPQLDVPLETAQLIPGFVAH